MSHFKSWKTQIRRWLKPNAFERGQDNLLKAVFDHSYFPKAFFSKDGKVKKANRAFCLLTGYTEAELKHLRLADFFEKEEAERELEAMSVFSGKTFESFDRKQRMKRKDGDRLWVSFTSTKIRDPKTDEELVMAELQNIHEKTRVEEEIRNSKSILQMVLDHIPVRVYWKNKDLEYIGCNRVFAKDAGFNHPRKVIGKVDRELRWAKNSKVICADDRKVIETGKASLREESKWTLKDGTTQWLHSNKIPLYDESGEFFALLGTFEDITEKKKTEVILKQNTDQLHLALRAADLGLWDWDLKTNLVNFDEGWCSMIGLDHKTVKQHFSTWEERVHPEDLNSALKDVRAHLEGCTPFYEMIHRLRHTDGSYRWILSRGKVTEFENGSPARFSGAHTDITEKRLLEVELEDQRTNMINSSRLAALGEMAGGVAHEINNPLAIIQGFASKMFRESSSKSLDYEELKRIAMKVQGTTERIAKIIRGLRSFSREASNDPFESKNVSEIMGETLDFCSQRIQNSNIELRIKEMSNELTLECRSVELSQVLLNLLNNATDAVSDLEEKWVSIEVDEAGDEIQIRITDSGAGIDSEISPRIMQPFFTTKDTGKGTGLGLSISKGIVEKHHGSLELDEAAKNTSFVLRLPKKQEI